MCTFYFEFLINDNGLQNGRKVISVINRPVGMWFKTPLTLREVWGSIPGPVKSDAVSPLLRCFVGALIAVAEMEPRHS